MNNASVALLSSASFAVLVFVLAHSTVLFTVVYRRNNLAAGLALVLFAAAVFLSGWWGVIAFLAGTLAGGWQWAASISRANDMDARSAKCAGFGNGEKSAGV